MSTSNDAELDAFYRVIAPCYDDDYADINPGSIDFYRRLAMESGGPVLEMGCGTGRILLPMARAGVDVHGLDSSQAMLDRLAENLQREPPEVRARVSYTLGDIRSLDLGLRFPLIISAGNVLHSFLDRQDHRAYFRNARRHLAPDGAFCFDDFQFDYRYLAVPPDQWVEDVSRVNSATGRPVRRYHRIEQEPEFTRFKVEMRWVEEDGEGRVVSDKTAAVMQRWFTRGELELLLEVEGFRITDYWGEFSFAPFGRGSTEHIIRAVAC